MPSKESKEASHLGKHKTIQIFHGNFTEFPINLGASQYVNTCSVCMNNKTSNKKPKSKQVSHHARFPKEKCILTF